MTSLQACEDSSLEEVYLGSFGHIGLFESLKSHPRIKRITFKGGPGGIVQQIGWHAAISAFGTALLQNSRSNIREIDLKQTNIDDR